MEYMLELIHGDLRESAPNSVLAGAFSASPRAVEATKSYCLGFSLRNS